MPDNNELANMLRAVIQQELKPVNERLAALEQGQQEIRDEFNPVNERLAALEQGQSRLESKVDKLELCMENEVIEKVRALFDGFTLRGDQIENLQRHLDQRLDSIEIDTRYLVSRIASLEKLAK
ncbi:MAG TPA: hypothetical protein PK728_11150 [Bacillota bacterium]|nr:hypothetical protein [Bacillota bacterium]